MEVPQAPRVPGDTETAILAATRDLLAEGGLEALSMRAVAARVGTTPTAIYHYFRNKDELVGRVVARGFQESEAQLWRAVESYPVGSIERLAALGEAYIRFAFGHQTYFKIIFGIRSDHPRELSDVPGQGGYGVLRQCVSDAMEAGTIRKADPDIVVLYLWSIVHGLVTLAMAFDFGSLLEDTAIEIPPGESAPRYLYQQFRDLIDLGLVPEHAEARS